MTPPITPVGLQPSQPTYPLDCPTCGCTLAPVALDPQTAPWLCPEVHSGLRAFFSCELQATVRLHFRPGHNDFGLVVHAALREDVASEIADAEARGTSVRPDQLSLVDRDALAAAKPHGDFATVVSQFLGSAS